MSELITHQLDVMQMPLQGIQLIEASAGTGKTWTLAALYVRLVLGHGGSGAGLMPPQILVMTFTEAATAELRDRIRERLAQAARFFKGHTEDADDFLRQLQTTLGSDHNLAHAAKLEAAAQWMDEAAIYTIHSWSSRMLRQHAFDSQSLFDQKRLDNAPALKLKLVKDYWREFIYPLEAHQLGALKDLGGTPEVLLKKIQPFWQRFEKTTDGFPDASLDPHPELALRAWEAWQVKAQQLEDTAKQLLSDHLQEVLSKLAQAFQKDLKANIYVPKKHAFFISHLSEWAAGEEADLETLKKFSLQKLRGSLKKDASPIDDARGVWQAIEDWLLVLAEEPAIGDNLLQHAAVKVGLSLIHI